jgi:hypothetical protein
VGGIVDNGVDGNGIGVLIGIVDPGLCVGAGELLNVGGGGHPDRPQELVNLREDETLSLGLNPPTKPFILISENPTVTLHLLDEV